MFMISLGIESTAHTFGIGIIDDNGNVLSNEKGIYKPKSGYGIVPRDAAEFFNKIKNDVLKNALEKSGLSLNKIDIISFSKGPGLPLSLKVGMDFAKDIAKQTKKPIYCVNHCIGHIEIGLLKTKATDPITVYVSGGNTQIIGYVEKRYRVFGETLDIAIGNALDMFARAVGLEHPGGPKIEELAKNGNYIELPYVVKGMDLSFSGIVSEAIRQFKKGVKIKDLCYSLQENCFAMITEVTERALAHTGKNEVLLTGGVAANQRLQEMLKIMTSERGAKFFVVPKEFSGDNPVMIAWTGLLIYKSGQKTEELDIRPRWRTDEVDIRYRND